jgi:hypothetical protein
MWKSMAPPAFSLMKALFAWTMSIPAGTEEDHKPAQTALISSPNLVDSSPLVWG